MSTHFALDPVDHRSAEPRCLVLDRPEAQPLDGDLTITTSGRRRAARGPMRVALCGASPVISHGLAAVLRDFADRIALVDLRPLPPSLVDLVLVDVSLDTETGSQHVRHLTGAGFTSVLGLGGIHSPDAEELLREAGACGFVSLSTGAAELVHLLEVVHARRGHPRPALVTPHLWQVDATLEIGCTGREAQILGLVCRGLSNAEIAHELHVSINTVKTYVRTAYRKIGLTRRTQVMIWGHQHGL